ncbi:MAG: hypothetical protein L0Z51_00820 [Candidatus Latescibacteria bacterium]|nr:hypothetical protein [Candidatus Latescibacterota bacterium]
MGSPTEAPRVDHAVRDTAGAGGEQERAKRHRRAADEAIVLVERSDDDQAHFAIDHAQV